MVVQTVGKPATEKQVAFVHALVGQKVLTVGQLAAVEQDLAGEFTTKKASELIGHLMALKNQPTQAAAPGYYVREGQVFVVVENKAKTSTYAKQMVKGAGKSGKWFYAPGVGRDIAKEGLEVLTLEAAAALGHLHGFCMICGRELKVPASVLAGIGPVCMKKLH